jgi:ribonuclease BN (tRNA processing enzyme)
MPSGAGSTRTAPDEANVRRAGTKRTVTMELIFIGTRGNTKVRTRHHRRHSALLINYRGRNIMIDCGADWLPAVQRLSPFAIVLTHAHPDHADGLARGAPCPVFATAETWQRLKHVPVTQKRIVPKCGPIRIGGLMFEGFPVEHSLRAPAVGYRISAREFILLCSRLGRHQGTSPRALGSRFVHRRWCDRDTTHRAATTGEPYRPYADPHANRMVPEGGRASSDLHPLRLGDRPRRRAACRPFGARSRREAGHPSRHRP